MPLRQPCLTVRCLGAKPPRCQHPSPRRHAWSRASHTRVSRHLHPAALPSILPLGKLRQGKRAVQGHRGSQWQSWERTPRPPGACAHPTLQPSLAGLSWRFAHSASPLPGRSRTHLCPLAGARRALPFTPSISRCSPRLPSHAPLPRSNTYPRPLQGIQGPDAERETRDTRVLLSPLRASVSLPGLHPSCPFRPPSLHGRHERTPRPRSAQPEGGPGIDQVIRRESGWASNGLFAADFLWPFPAQQWIFHPLTFGSPAFLG